MERVVEKWVGRAGLEENYTIHSLRHTFAMNQRKKAWTPKLFKNFWATPFLHLLESIHRLHEKNSKKLLRLSSLLPS